jgi:hypothetical protein
MSKRITRRDLLRLAGGSALGVMMTPLPWKLLDDSAIWTQNWSLIPPLPRGAGRTLASACTICPGGCPVNARCVGGVPVSLSGVAGHPVGDGTLCPLGLAGHHLAFHPRRIVQPWRKVNGAGGPSWVPARREEVIGDISRRLRTGGISGTVGLLDRRPGRSVSLMYRDFLEGTGNGVYLTSHGNEESALGRIRKRTRPDAGPLGYDLGRASIVLSFGAPLLDGWGNPGAVRRIFADRNACARLIQVEPRQSRTALRSDLWIAAPPGTEAVLARGIGRAILAEGLLAGGALRHLPDLDDYRRWVEPFNPGVVRDCSGVGPDVLVKVARDLTTAGPAVVLDGSDPAGGPLDAEAREAIVALNVLIGSVNRAGGILPRPAFGDAGPGAGDESELCDLPDGSLGLLILDDAEPGLALPESIIRDKIDPRGGIIVAFSPYLAGAALAADVVLPVPAPYESIGEVYAPLTDPRPAMGLAAPLLPPRSRGGKRESYLSDIGRIAGHRGAASPGSAHYLDRRIASILRSKGGTIVAPGPAPDRAVEDFRSVADLREAMLGGAWWISPAPTPGRPVVARLLPEKRMPSDTVRVSTPSPTSPRLLLVPAGWRGPVGKAAVPPLASKLFRESELRYPAGHAAVNPATAETAGIADRGRGRIVTGRGRADVVVHRDARVMPGIIELSCAAPSGEGWDLPDPLTLCETGADGSWRMTPAFLETL